MHPVHVGICRDNHLIIPQTFQAILNIQGRLKQVKLGVRLFVIEPLAESPSVIKILLSSSKSPFESVR